MTWLLRCSATQMTPSNGCSAWAVASKPIPLHAMGATHVSASPFLRPLVTYFALFCEANLMIPGHTLGSSAPFLFPSLHVPLPFSFLLPLACTNPLFQGMFRKARSKTL